MSDSSSDLGWVGVAFGVVAIVAIVAVSGSLWTAGGLDTTNASFEHDGGVAADAVDYSFEPDCRDHTNYDGERIHSCSARLSLNDTEQVDYLELRIVGHSGETGVWTATGNANDSVTADVWARSPAFPHGNITYSHRAVVSAVFADGDVRVLERHTFTCEDVDYRDACASRGGEST